MAFHEVEGEQEQLAFQFLKLSAPGDSITGVYVKKFDHEGKFGKETQLLLRETQANGDVQAWALRENGDLRTKFSKVKPGQVVRVTYCGDGEAITLRDGTQGNPPRLYRVEVDDGKP